jgi:uncharacterized protein YxjI
LEDIKSSLEGKSQLYLMDQKIIKPYVGPVPINFESYRTKLIKDSEGNDILRIDYNDNPSAIDQPARGFARIAQMVARLLDFKVADTDGNFLYSVRSKNGLSNKLEFRISNGDDSKELYSGLHKMMNLAKESTSILSLDGNLLLGCEFRGFKRTIEVKDGNGSIVATIHAPVISLRDRWQIDYNGDCDKILVLIMVAIISELGQR